MMCQLLLKGHQSIVSLSFAFFHKINFPNSLTIEDLLEVGSLSCRVTFKTRILFITKRLLLSRASFTGRTISLSYD